MNVKHCILGKSTDNALLGDETCFEKAPSMSGYSCGQPECAIRPSAMLNGH